MAEYTERQTGGKKIKNARKSVNAQKTYAPTEAIDLLKNINFTKFIPTLDVVFTLGVDPRHSDQMVRGVVNLPAGTGKSVRVAVICKDEKIADAKAAGADLAGLQDLIDEIKSGKIDFDVCIATPDVMGSVGQVARILGPKGLMPNPKLGTVTQDIATAVKNAKAGQVEFRVDKCGIIHAGIGKLSFTTEDLKSNLSALHAAIVRSKPAASKGTYIKAVYLSTTMGPACKIDISALVN
jgi:large subunit ribosomal protein L1